MSWLGGTIKILGIQRQVFWIIWWNWTNHCRIATKPSDAFKTESGRPTLHTRLISKAPGSPKSELSFFSFWHQNPASMNREKDLTLYKVWVCWRYRLNVIGFDDGGRLFFSRRNRRYFTLGQLSLGRFAPPQKRSLRDEGQKKSFSWPLIPITWGSRTKSSGCKTSLRTHKYW